MPPNEMLDFFDPAGWGKVRKKIVPPRTVDGSSRDTIEFATAYSLCSREGVGGSILNRRHSIARFGSSSVTAAILSVEITCHRYELDP